MTNKRTGARLGIVEDEFAVHNLHNAEPELVLDAVPRRGRGLGRLLRWLHGL